MRQFYIILIFMFALVSFKAVDHDLNEKYSRTIEGLDTASLVAKTIKNNAIRTGISKAITDCKAKIQNQFANKNYAGILTSFENLTNDIANANEHNNDLTWYAFLFIITEIGRDWYEFEQGQVVDAASQESTI